MKKEGNPKVLRSGHIEVIVETRSRFSKVSLLTGVLVPAAETFFSGSFCRETSSWWGRSGRRRGLLSDDHPRESPGGVVSVPKVSESKDSSYRLGFLLLLREVFQISFPSSGPLSVSVPQTLATGLARGVVRGWRTSLTSQSHRKSQEKRGRLRVPPPPPSYPERIIPR